MQEDLTNGMMAASSILHRANDAIDKEQRVEAVTELQSRVEDWKGHKIDHFGELLLHGNFTVLKGEGAKEVEREVGKVFDSLPPKLIAMFLDRIMEESMLDPQTPLSNTSTCMSPDMWVPPGDTLATKRLRTISDSVPERVPGEERKKNARPNVPAHASASSSNTQNLTPGLTKKRSVPAFNKMKVGSKAPPIQNRPRSPDFGIAPLSETRILLTYSCDGNGAKLGLTPDQRSKLRPNGVLPASGFTTFRFEYTGDGSEDLPSLGSSFQWDSCLKLKMRSPYIWHMSPTLSYAELTTIYSTANTLGIRAPMRTQYKVYLFERILLCCKEINPNKPRNKMLGNNKPPIDKKGKPRLQLKGRIFMQNVTDVVSFVDKGL